MTLGGRHHQRRAALLVGQVDVGAVSQQEVDDLQAHRRHSAIQTFRPQAEPVKIQSGRVRGQEAPPTDLPVTLPHGAEQRHHAPPVGLAGGGALLQQQAANLQLPPTSGRRQSCSHTGTQGIMGYRRQAPAKHLPSTSRL